MSEDNNHLRTFVRGGQEPSQSLNMGKFLWIEGGERKGLDFLEFLLNPLI